jgi:site-specific recombinase XerD
MWEYPPFIAEDSPPSTSEGHNQLLDALAADADLVDDDGHAVASAHTLRHTFGTNLLRSGVDIVTVAELMGHRRLDTTRLYTLPTERDLEDAVAKLPTDQ